jgi:hypothetical protein
MQGTAMAPGDISMEEPRKICLKQAHTKWTATSNGRFLFYKFPHRIRNRINVKKGECKLKISSRIAIVDVEFHDVEFPMQETINGS